MHLLGDLVNASVKLIEQVVPSTVGIHAFVPPSHASAPLLGTERMGSGTVVDSEGYILTVNYIVIGAAKIQVGMLDSQQYDAEVVAQDFVSGVALLKIPNSGFPPAKLHSSVELQPGDEVFMVASSDDTTGRRVSGGFLSNVGPYEAYWEYRLDRALICSAMNPGLGGGPMFDMKGRMIGVVSLNLGEVGKFSLAIPVEDYLDHKEEFLRYGRRVSRPSRAWIGMYSYPLRDHMVLAGLLPGGPGEKAGLKAGDVVLAIDGQEITDRHTLYTQVWNKHAGDTVLFRVFRNNSVQDIAVVSGNLEEFLG